MPLVTQILKPGELNAAHLAFLADRAFILNRGERLSTVDVMQTVLDDLVAEGVLGVA